MSKPIRYGLSDADLGRIHPQADGHLVMWADYAALAAENERLRKAGDAMAFNYEQMHSHDGVYDSDLMKYVNAWLAAKEGGAK